MIELTAASAIMLYLLITVGAILTVWAFHHFSKRKDKLKMTEKELCSCEYCHFNYLDSGIKKVTRCPQCGSYNQGLKNK